MFINVNILQGELEGGRNPSDMINTTGSPAAAVATPKEYFRDSFSDNNVSEPHIEIHQQAEVPFISA